MSKKRKSAAPRLRRQAADLMRRGELREARELLERSLELEPGHPGGLNNLGAARRALSDLPGAIECYREALRLDASVVATRFNLANALKESGNFDEAIATYAEVLRIDPENVAALNNLGIAYRQTGRHAQAEDAFRRALEIRPGYGAALRNLSGIFEDRGDFDAARRCLLDAISGNPRDAKALGKLIASRAGEPDPRHLEQAAWLLESDSVAEDARAQLHYGLGKYHDRAGDSDAALAHFRSANRIKARPSGYDPDVMARRVDELCDAFSREVFDKFRDAGSADARPVFVVGMPRTGTTLAEQILASHPLVAGAGELPYFGSVTLNFRDMTGGRDAFPKGIEKLAPTVIADLAGGYRTVLDDVSMAAERVVDKMPQNFLYLGLIALLFPSATIIHCWRDPRDVCLSCFVEDFNAAHGFATDPRVFLAFFREYWRLMGHWRRVLPIEIFDLRYEDLVRHHEATARTLIEAAGCQWDERCLSYYEQDRTVSTPSRWQVRQPIYATSVGRWERYRDFLAPVLPALTAFSEAGSPGKKSPTSQQSGPTGK